MTRYLIEVPHGADKDSCTRAIQIFLETGNHFLANADWGCFDGEHKAWFIMNADNKDEVRMILPPVYRQVAHITILHTFTTNELDEMVTLHPA
jgi:hypothetical protein